MTVPLTGCPTFLIRTRVSSAMRSGRAASRTSGAGVSTCACAARRPPIATIVHRNSVRLAGRTMCDRMTYPGPEPRLADRFSRRGHLDLGFATALADLGFIKRRSLLGHDLDPLHLAVPGGLLYRGTRACRNLIDGDLLLQAD